MPVGQFAGRSGGRTVLVSWDDVQAEAFYPIDRRVAWWRLDHRPGLVDKIRRSLRLARTLRQQGVQVLIGFVMSGDRTVYAAAKLSGVHLVAAERNAPSMYRLRYSARQRWQSFFLMRFLDRIVVQFPDYADGYPATLQGRINVIANPVTPAVSRAKPAEPDIEGRYRLLAISRLDEVQKRLACLFDAFARVADDYPNWDLLVVGDGPDKGALEKRIETLQLSDRVRISPSRCNVSDVYLDSNLFAIPSLWEGFPNALAEAMAHGLPAVGFAGADGVAHLVVDGENGWLAVGVDDPGTLARALAAAMGDHAGRSHRGARAAAAMAAFVPDVQFDKWQSLIEELMLSSQNAVQA